MIGIVGGIGPLAGADLYKKIVANTVAQTDQDHLPVLLASIPGEIPGRPDFLLGKSTVNPGPAIARVVLLLERAGAQYVGIACNTAHAPQIFDAMTATLDAQGARVQIVHMIDETMRAILADPDRPRRIGVLCTSGIYQTGFFQNTLREAGLGPVLLEFQTHESLVQDAIHSIKSATTGFDARTIAQLNTAIAGLKDLGAQGLLLGCTELGMLEELLDFKGLAVINPSTILARALIRKLAPAKLLP